MSSSILTSRLTLLPLTVLGLGGLASVAGAASLLYPRDAITWFGLRPVDDHDGMELAEALVQVYGVRNMSMGITNVALWWIGHKTTGPLRIAWCRVLGLVFIMNAATPIVDGIVSERQGRTNGWKHWIFTPFTVLIGGALMMTADV